MKIQNMRYFLQVAKYGSISEAARQVYISQSTISTALQEIEKELGIILFERGRGGVALTPDGEDCLQYCQEIVEKTDALTQRYSGGNLSTDYFAVTSCHLPVAARAFSKFMEHSEMDRYNLCMREESIIGVLEDVISGRSDLGVVSVTREQIETIDRQYKNLLQFVKLGELKKYVFVHSNHPLAGKERLTEAELAPYPYVTYDQGEMANTFSEEKLFYKKFPKNVHVCDRATKLSLVRNSDAFTIGVDLPNFSADFFFRKTAVELTAIPLADDEETYQIGYLIKSNSRLWRLSLAYVEYLEEEIRLLETYGKQ